jgi:hypothetical protein
MAPSRKRASSNHTAHQQKRPAPTPKTAEKASSSKVSSSGSKNTVTKQSSIPFPCSKRPKYQLGTKILLDDQIYDDKVPDEVKDHYFVYEIVGLLDGGKHVRIEYKRQAIKGDGDTFRFWKDSEDPEVRLIFCLCPLVCFQSFLTMYLSCHLAS